MGWLGGWIYRKSHEIDGPTAGAQTNYPIKVVVHRASGADSGEDVYVETKCRADFGDIRFTKDDGSTELDYWLEAYDGGVATFWVEVDSIPASPDSVTIYVYYGKSDATTTSDGEATFTFFDHFPGSSLDPTKWTESGTGTVTVVDSYVKIHGTSGYKGITSISGWSGNRAVRRLALRTAKNGYSVMSYGENIVDADGASVFIVNTNEVWARISRAGVKVDRVIAGNYTANIWYLAITQISHDVRVTSLWGVAEQVETANVPQDDAPKQLGLSDYQDAGDLWVDWILLRKYEYPEPAHGAWGSEELPTIERFQEEGTDFMETKFGATWAD